MQKHSKDELQRQTIRLGLVWLKFTQPAKRQQIYALN